MTVELEGEEFFRYLKELKLKALDEQKKLDSHTTETSLVVVLFPYRGPRLTRDFLEEVNSPGLISLPGAIDLFMVDRSTLYSNSELEDSEENDENFENS